MQVAAVIAASGEGQRMGGERKKQYLLLDGVPSSPGPCRHLTARRRWARSWWSSPRRD